MSNTTTTQFPTISNLIPTPNKQPLILKSNHHHVLFSTFFVSDVGLNLKSKRCNVNVNGGVRMKVVSSGIDSVSSSSSSSSLPVSIELKPILNESQFDRVIAEADQIDESVVILWMATWCRKCIYLKPKLEKLAADYHPRVRFYCIDVNNVPHKLVVRAGVTVSCQ
ncbi:Thioredoxin [Artemisia annua]|uniref:Thioredoxin n=1 Tax=Artemisia annua TaxID=35608 RepID=A0A2U1NHD1_ARTAN|nr:Thioredoxin [Artemisia annua]